MGDARYYTYYQFYHTILLTVFAMAVSASFVVSYYKDRNKNDWYYISRLLIQLLVIGIAKIVEGVIPSYTVAFTLRYLVSILNITLNITAFYYLFVYMFPVVMIDEDNIYKRQVLQVIYVLNIVLYSGIAVMGKSEWIIQSYQFITMDYGIVYLLEMSLVILISSVIVVRIYCSKSKLHAIYSNKIITLIIVFMLILPLIGYTVLSINHNMKFIFVEIGMYFVILIVLNIVIYTSTSFGLTTLAFDRIGDMIKDYVFVTDISDNIIYRNRIAKESRYFEKRNQLSSEKIGELFVGDTKERINAAGNSYIQLMIEDSEYYFTYKSKEIVNNNELVGMMVTVTEVTQLVEMVSYLEERKVKAQASNEALENYSKVVYYVEKEKAVDALLDEIITAREKSMVQLIDKIKGLEQIDDDLFEKEIEKVIQFNAEILEEVRRSVSGYRD